jgi:hypothetical protein
MARPHTFQALTIFKEDDVKQSAAHDVLFKSLDSLGRFDIGLFIEYNAYNENTYLPLVVALCLDVAIS